MNSLRARLIRMAATDAELRPVLLPLLKEASSLLPRDEGVIAAWWSYKPKTGDLLMSDGKTLWLTVEGAKISVAVWDSRFKYTFTPITGFRLVDMVQEAVREWGINRPVVRQRIKNSPGIMLDGRVAMDDKTAFGRMTSRDETVIRRWWEHKAMEGDFLFSDGETLSGLWGDVATPLAVWQGWGTFKMIPTLNAKKRQVQNEIRELAPGSDGPFALSGSDSMDEAMRFANSTPTSRTATMTLRAKLIRLASENLDIRPHILPLLVDDTRTAAAKAPKAAPKLKGKKLDDAISKAYYRNGQGVQVNIMDIGKIYDAGKKAYEAADTVEAADAALEEAMKAAIAKYRQN